MPANWNIAVRRLIDAEGGFSIRDNRNGAVNMGITQYFLKLIDRPHSVEDVKSLTREEVVEIYRFYFWVRFNLRDINSQRIAEALLKCLVNTDPQEVIMATHEALASLGKPVINSTVPKRVRVLGTSTVNALNSLSAEAEQSFMDRFKDGMARFYKSLDNLNPKEYGDDLNGWLRRVDAL